MQSGTIWKLGCGFVLTFYSNNGAILYRLRHSDLLVENRDIFITQLYVAPTQEGWPRRNFAKMFDIRETRIIGLLCGEETMTIC